MLSSDDDFRPLTRGWTTKIHGNFLVLTSSMRFDSTVAPIDRMMELDEPYGRVDKKCSLRRTM